MGKNKMASAGNVMAVGHLKVTIFSARDLHESFLSRNDPYVVIRLGGKRSQTRVAQHGKNPAWNHVEYIPYEGEPRMDFQVADADLVSDDDQIGIGYLQMMSVPPTGFRGEIELLRQSRFSVRQKTAGWLKVSVQIVQPGTQLPATMPLGAGHPMAHQVMPGGPYFNSPIAPQAMPVGPVTSSPTAHQAMPVGPYFNSPTAYQAMPAGSVTNSPTAHQAMPGGSVNNSPTALQAMPGGPVSNFPAASHTYNSPAGSPQHMDPFSAYPMPHGMHGQRPMSVAHPGSEMTNVMPSNGEKLKPSGHKKKKKMKKGLKKAGEMGLQIASTHIR